MSLFMKKHTPKIPEECCGMEVRVMSSTCFGEKTIGFYDRKTHELHYSELVKTQSDIDAFYERYGIEKQN